MTIARNIARAVGSSVRAGRIGPEGGITGQFSATIYDSTVSLPTTGISAGAQAYVRSNQRLYIRGTGGWYNIATINNTPNITSIQTAGGDSSPFTLATDGTTTTVVTITATDSEGFPITFSVVTDAGFDSIATVSQDSSVFTITPLSEDSVGTATSGTLTFKASDGVNIGSEVSTFNLSFKVLQSDFTTLLMKASGNNGTNTSIDDASSNVTITKVGTPTTHSFTPYHPGGYSVYFDGTGDFLSIADSTDFTLGTSNFTAECWIYPTASPNQPLIFGQWSNPYAWGIQLSNNSSRYLRFILNISGYVDTVSSETIVPLNEWSHLALVRNGSTFTLYFNGVSSLTVTNSGSITDASSALTIGGQSGGGQPFQGYIKDARFVVGDAVYTANFTPPTSSLTSTGSNTKLLACHAPYIADGSSETRTITVNGDTSVRRFSPYQYVAYIPSTHGASVHVDGGGDYLYFGSTPLSGNNGAFTIEAWVYPEVLNQYSNSVYSQGNAGGVSNFFDFQFNASGQLQIYLNGGSTSFTTTTGAVTANAWNHLAFSRSGTGSNEAKLFVNGKNLYTGTLSTLNSPSNGNGYIGSQIYSLGNTDRSVEGYISDFRITTSAVYTSDFTPPTSPLANIANTGVLTCNDTPNIFNAAGSRNEITLTNDVKSSTTVKKYASASILLDGTGDAVTIGDDINLDFGSEDFTMEGWYKADDTSGDHYLLSSSGGSFNAGPSHFGINIYQGNWRVGGFNDKLIGGVGSGVNTGIDTNWHHFAWTSNNRQIQFFVDGAQTGSTVDVTSDTFDCGGNFRIGSFHSNTGSGNWDGNLEDIRISKGLSRYPFIPHSTTLTSVSGSGYSTSLLTAHAATITDGSGNGHTISTGSGTPSVSDFAPHPGMKSIRLGTAGESNSGHLTVDLGSNGGPDADFTIQFWYYATNGNNSNAGFFHMSDTSGGFNSSTNALAVGTRSEALGVSLYANGNYLSGKPPLGYLKWTHFAMTRASGVIYLYRDGALIHTQSVNTDFSSYRYMAIGGFYGTGYKTPGWVSNFRYVKGTSLFSSSFTAPTSELTA